MNDSQRTRGDIKAQIEAFASLPYKKGPYGSRHWGHKFHSLISYPSKLKPSIAYFLVKLFTVEGDRILDPFSGVGTIPFEACLQGRIGVGSDMSPLAYHSTRAKIQPPIFQEVDKQMLVLEQFINSRKDEVAVDDVEPEIVPFYHIDTLREIAAAREFFNGDEVNSPSFSFILACMLHILHGNRPYALSRRSHNIMPWPPKGEFIYKPVMRSLSDKVYRMLRVGFPLSYKRGKVLQDDALCLSVSKESFDTIITSPPFHGNRDFLRMNRIRLWFCGWDYNYQEAVKSKFLEHQPELDVYKRVFREMWRVLKPGGLCIMHLGVVRKLDMGQSITPFAEDAGFEIHSIIYEDTSRMESHGIRDRGATHKHQFLIASKI